MTGVPGLSAHALVMELDLEFETSRNRAREMELSVLVTHAKQKPVTLQKTKKSATGLILLSTVNSANGQNGTSARQVVGQDSIVVPDMWHSRPPTAAMAVKVVWKSWSRAISKIAKLKLQWIACGIIGVIGVHVEIVVVNDIELVPFTP